MKFLLITDEGIEDLAAQELLDARPSTDVQGEPFGFKGQLVVDGAALDELRRLTTIQHVIELRGQATACSLTGIERELRRIEVPEMVGAASFRVTSERRGEHEFDHMELQRVAGAVLVERYGTRVDLEHYELNVRVNLYGDRLIVGVQRTAESLAKRIQRVRSLRTALKPTIAAAMIRLIGAHRGAGRLIDPLCGTGTIPIEAKRINPQLTVFASDWDDETVETARGTVANHGLDIQLRQCDARTLTSWYEQPFDYIVTDPPYGVRQAKHTDIGLLYENLLTSFARALADAGILAIVVLKLRAFQRALEGAGLRVVHERLIESGGLHPRIFVLERE
jgi:putative N6-adenine-specific DNA methylase/tRNA (guanine6-N2)-methyltransferase